MPCPGKPSLSSRLLTFASLSCNATYPTLPVFLTLRCSSLELVVFGFDNAPKPPSADCEMASSGTGWPSTPYGNFDIILGHFWAYLSAIPPIRAVWHALLSAHAPMLIGACNPTLYPIHVT